MSLDASVEPASWSNASLSDSPGSAQGLYCAAGALVIVLHLRLDDDADRTGFDTGAAGLGAGAGVREELERSWLLDVEFRKAGARPLLVVAEGRSWPRDAEPRSFGFWSSPPLDVSPARLSREGLGRSDDVELEAEAGAGAGWTMPETGRGSREGRGMPLTRLWELSIFT